MKSEPRRRRSDPPGIGRAVCDQANRIRVTSTEATTPMRHARHNLISRSTAATASALRCGIGRIVTTTLAIGCGLVAFAGPADETIQASGDIAWLIPEDGGTPRDPRRI